jgi:biopolymer transport protein ExbD
VSEDELLAKLKSISEAYPDQAVILRGSSEANFQAIINVLDEIKKAGIWNVAFAYHQSLDLTPQSPPNPSLSGH